MCFDKITSYHLQYIKLHYSSQAIKNTGTEANIHSNAMTCLDWEELHAYIGWNEILAKNTHTRDTYRVSCAGICSACRLVDNFLSVHSWDMLNLDESGVNKITHLLCISLMKKKILILLLPFPSRFLTSQLWRLEDGRPVHRPNPQTHHLRIRIWQVRHEPRCHGNDGMPQKNGWLGVGDANRWLFLSLSVNHLSI